MTQHTEAQLLSRMRWRSRRGMLELDQLLVRYLNQAWTSADAEERETYRRLLECEDTDLWTWVQGKDRPEDGSLDTLIQKIRNLPVR